MKGCKEVLYIEFYDLMYIFVKLLVKSFVVKAKETKRQQMEVYFACHCYCIVCIQLLIKIVSVAVKAVEFSGK